MIDPITKLPIWPDGKVPEHPRDKHGNPILPQPSWVPPPEPFEPPIGTPQASGILEHLQKQIDELRERVDRL
jgi:hypothetical protein